jgi:PhzF family phenazine biosynthesis protein
VYRPPGGQGFPLPGSGSWAGPRVCGRAAGGGKFGGMKQKIVQVDSFTDTPYRGNPAAVCVLESAAEERWMQDVAREMNLSETAFLHRAGGGYRLRWFTPAAEVALCGHATLAAAHVLWEEGHARAGERLEFQTLSGVLAAERRDGWIELDFPATPAEPASPPPALLEALGVTAPVAVAKSRFDYLVEVPSAAEVRALAPDFGALGRVEVRGVMVTAGSDVAEADFVSRFFAPAVGVPEDPVTGSAHCCLAPWWAAKLGRQQLVGYQASARGGVVRVEHRGERVILGGRAVTVLRGELVA